MSLLSPTFLKVELGTIVERNGEVFEVTHLLSVDCVLGRSAKDGQIQRLRVEDLTLPLEKPVEEKRTVPDLLSFSDKDWKVAQDRLAVIKPLLDLDYRTRADVEGAARSAGVHTGTIYAWLKLYLDANHVSALVPDKTGPRVGTHKLAKEQEEVIASVLEDEYLHRQKRTAAHVIEEVERRCRLAKIKIPHGNTIRARIKEISPAHVLRRRGERDKARDKFSPILGQFPDAPHPLSVVQIDHTEVDIILVDDVHRKPLGRPWLTLAVDVFSRMAVGLYISMERPGAAATGMCLSHAICKKTDYLNKLGIQGNWPVWGVPAVVHADNAREFRGEVIQRAAAQYNFDLNWRMVKTPHYGGHIERYMGLVANKARQLPGATFSNPSKRKGYDSEKEAALTLREFEIEVVDWLVNIYHQKPHGETLLPPIKKWQLGIYAEGTSGLVGLPPIPANPERVRLDFMPFEDRTVQPYGVVIDDIHFNHEVLYPLINTYDPDRPRYKRKYLFRYDPRDISQIYYFDPLSEDYVAIPYRNRGRPAISMWELREARKRLKEEGRRDLDEDSIFEAINRSRERVAAAQEKTKAARKQAQRVRTTDAVVAERTQHRPEAEKPTARADFSSLFDEPVVKIKGSKVI